jgi:hypothetical protein
MTSVAAPVLSELSAYLPHRFVLSTASIVGEHAPALACGVSLLVSGSGWSAASYRGDKSGARPAGLAEVIPYP